MKTPIAYWGGKIMMAKYILPLIPKHTTYVEAFVGGGAIYFAKEAVKTNILNDKNDAIVAIYETLQDDEMRERLFKKLKKTLFSQTHLKEALNIYNNQEGNDKVELAWGVIVGSGLSYRKSMCDVLEVANEYDHAQPFFNKIIRMAEPKFIEKVKKAEIVKRDACNVIKRFGKYRDTFVYADPPYFNADMAHYEGYTLQDFTNLLDTLVEHDCNFLLSSYKSDILTEYVEKHEWHQIILKLRLSSSVEKGKTKEEVLTMNYQPNKLNQLYNQ